MNSCAAEMVKAWEEEKRSVTMTNREWSKLTSYIIMSANFRKREAEAWEELSTEKKDDGTPVYEHAASNAEYWRELDAKLEEIRRKIDG